MTQDNDIINEDEQLSAEQKFLYRLGEVAEKVAKATGHPSIGFSLEHPPAYLDSSPRVLSLWKRLTLFLRNLFKFKSNSKTSQDDIGELPISFDAFESDFE